MSIAEGGNKAQRYALQSLNDEIKEDLIDVLIKEDLIRCWGDFPCSAPP